MQHWYNMAHKWGFDDGDDYPPIVFETRELYVRALNELGEHLGSAVQAEAYTWNTCHNEYRIDFSEGEWGSVKPDSAMQRAIDTLLDVDLDRCLSGDGSVKEALYNQIMTTVKKGISS